MFKDMEIKRPEPIQSMPEHAKQVFEGEIFDVYQWEQKMYDGSVATFERLKRPDTVIVFPVLPNGNILLTKQEQPGLKPFIGAAGGQVDKGEGILEAAHRELLEETGCVAKEMILWKATQNHRKIDWVVFVFIAKGIERVSDLRLDPG
jgi:ADP-ribose pyrophosphatase